MNKIKKIWVIGSSGSGKSYFTRKLSDFSGYPNYCLDNLFWLPHWQKKEMTTFIKEVAELAKTDTWIIEGVYSQVAPVILKEVDSVIWLDPPLYKMSYRVLKRSIFNLVSKREICNGNRETFTNFFSRHSIFLFLLKSYRSNRQDYTNYCHDLMYYRPEVTVYRMKNWDDTLIQQLIGVS